MNNYQTRSKRKILGLLLLLLCTGVSLYAQTPPVPDAKTGEQSTPTQVTLTGKVLDEKGETMPGVLVNIKGTSKIVQTNDKGEFSINTKQGAQVDIRLSGYTTESLTVLNNHPAVTITLRPEHNVLGETVITGIFKKSTASYVGSATTVTAEELQAAGNRNLVASLNIIDPSFRLIENNIKGSDPNNMALALQIRGNNSLPPTNQLADASADIALQKLNMPLIILDGFESTVEKMLTMNENDVESITLLKDAAATALYGSRGTNGVVVITTRQPKAGKLRVSYTGSLDVEIPDLTSYSVLDARQKLDLEQKMGYFNNADNVDKDQQLKRYYSYLLNEVNSGVDTYWLSQPTRTGYGQNHSLRFEGGDQTFRYSASIQLGDIQGVMKGSSQRNYNGTVNLSYSQKNIRFSNVLMLGQSDAENSPYGDFDQYVKLNPYWRTYDADGNLIKQLGDSGNDDYRVTRLGRLVNNPLYEASLNSFNTSTSFNFANNTSVDWTFVKGLDLRGRFGISKNNTQTDVFRSAESTDFINFTDADIFRKGSYAYGNSNSFSINGQVNLSYSKVFAKKHQLFAGLDASVKQSEMDGVNINVEGFPNSDMNEVGMAIQYAKNGKPGGSNDLSRTVGFTSNVNYSYDARYFVDASLRLDGSSKFGSEKRFAPFWAAGIGWNVHNEKFMANQKVVNRLKLRGSLGITGSQNFPSNQAITTYQYSTTDRYGSQIGATLIGLGNRYLSWQQTNKYDVGLDAVFLHDRLKVTTDYYIQRTDGLISSRELAASNGFPYIMENIGTVENRGYELRASYTIINNKKSGITWSVSAAAMHNINKIVKVSQSLKDAQARLEASTGVPSMNSFREGYSTSTIWLVPSLGIDPGTGKELFLGKDGIATYTWNAKDVIAAGTTNSDLEGNFGTSFRYKNFTLNVYFGYNYGGQAYNETLLNKVEIVDYGWNVDSRVYTDRWQKPGDHTAFKALQVNEKTPKTTRFLQDNNTINCQNINVQYAIPSKVTKSIGLESVSVFGNMSDVFYISTIKRERGTSYPFARRFSLGLNVTF